MITVIILVNGHREDGGRYDTLSDVLADYPDREYIVSEIGRLVYVTKAA